MTPTQEPETPRSTADERFLAYLHRAELGRLGPSDFVAIEDLLPHVSPELRELRPRRS